MDVFSEVHAHAKKRGFDLHLTSDHLRAIASSLFIRDAGGGPMTPHLAIVPPPEVRAKAAHFPDRIEQVKELRKETATPQPRPFSGTAPLDPCEVLSPSKVNQFAHDCQVKWFCRHVLKLPETRGAALGLGTAVHDAILENYRQRA